MISKVEKKLLHYMGKAIALYNMIQEGDRLLLCLSGGKDSFGLVKLMQVLKSRAKINFKLHILSLDQGWSGWNREAIANWLEASATSFTILDTTIAQVVQTKSKPGVSPCVLCSRLRRGHIYSFAKQYDYNKVVLGHHRDDLITSLLMSICYSGDISSMPPKLVTTDRKLIVIRPLVLCQEKDLLAYAHEQKFPITQASICSVKNGDNVREKVNALIRAMAVENPKIPSNMLHALGAVKVSQLMDHKLWDFRSLEKLLR